MDEETKDFLIQAVAEIRALRRQNEIMGAQLDVLETVRWLVAGPRPPQSYAVDITSLIEDYLAGKK